MQLDYWKARGVCCDRTTPVPLQATLGDPPKSATRQLPKNIYNTVRKGQSDFPNVHTAQREYFENHLTPTANSSFNIKIFTYELLNLQPQTN